MKHKKNLDKPRNKKGQNRPKNEPGSGSSKIHKNPKPGKPSKQPEPSKPTATVVRKRVDPELAKYFTEIGNLLENGEMEVEERATVCGNALLEASGKEVELAMDAVISHTMQSLLEGCELEQLCNFLRSCAKGFAEIAKDKFGSHVAETAIKSLARHLDEEGAVTYIENPLSKICQVVVADYAGIMCCRYGSHVLRSLLCLCKGVPMDSVKEFHETKRDATLVERLNIKGTKTGPSNLEDLGYGFPVIYKSLVREMLNNVKNDIATVRLDKYGSFVLQTVLKLSIGDEDALHHAISILLGFQGDGKSFDITNKQEILGLIEGTASSHLLEVIIEVAPGSLYTKLLTEVFKGSLFEISSHHCGNFVVQALVSYTKTKDQIDVVWNELGSKFKELLQLGKSGVVASVLAACKRLDAHGYECLSALATAVRRDSESSSNIVSHLLFLDSFLRGNPSGAWSVGDKMNVLGSLMLQIIFTYPKQHIEQYITSMMSMDADQVFQMAKDARSSHVLEAFLSSDLAAKLKYKVINKLKGHFGDLAISPSGSYTVEKCFSTSNLSLKEVIAEELQNVQSDLSNTKHGPYLLRKLDIAGFSSGAEQWKQALASKQNLYKEFNDIFGSTSKVHEKKMQGSFSSQKSMEKRGGGYEKSHAGNFATASEAEFPAPKNSKFTQQKQGNDSNDFVKKNKFTNSNNKKSDFVKDSSKRKHSATSLADLGNLASKSELSAAEIDMLFKPTLKNDNEQFGRDRAPFLKKQRR